MAVLPGRPAERRLRTVPLPLLLLALSGPAGPGGLAAQEEADTVPVRAGAHLEVKGGLGLLQGEVVPVLGGAGLIGLSDAVRVGGAGAVFTSDGDVEGDLVHPERALSFGYGGVLLDLVLPTGAGRSGITVRTLFGAGHVEVRDRRTGMRLASDNVAVVEPGITVRRRLSPRFGAGLSASWRAVLGLEDVEGVDPADLSAPTLALHLFVGPL